MGARWVSRRYRSAACAVSAPSESAVLLDAWAVTAMMTDERLAYIERVTDATSMGDTGEWFTLPGEDGVHIADLVDTEDGGRLQASEIAYCDAKEDAEFIALARTAVPELVAEVRRLRALVLA